MPPSQRQGRSTRRRRCQQDSSTNSSTRPPCWPPLINMHCWHWDRPSRKTSQTGMRMPSLTLDHRCRDAAQGTDMSDVFDLVVVGAGSGGVAASRRAAAHGARVLIVEADRVGGTCVIRGCVPKKLMMYAAGFGQAFEDARAYGWTGSTGSFEMHRWADAKAIEIQRLEGIYRKMLTDSGVELALGRARLLGSGAVAVGDRTVQARRVLIATGGAPAHDAL